MYFSHNLNLDHFWPQNFLKSFFQKNAMFSLTPLCCCNMMRKISKFLCNHFGPILGTFLPKNLTNVYVNMSYVQLTILSYGLILILQAYAKYQKNSGGQFFEKLQKPHFQPT